MDTNAIEHAVSEKVLKNQVFHFDSAGKIVLPAESKQESPPLQRVFRNRLSEVPPEYGSLSGSCVFRDT